MKNEMKNDKPKIQIVFPNILLAFVPFSILWICKVFEFLNCSWWTVISPLLIYLGWCCGWLLLSLLSVSIAYKIKNKTQR